MEWIMNQTFEHETILFDGFSFIGCTFKHCVIIINSMSFDFDRCSFIDSTFHVNPELPLFELPEPIAQSFVRSIAPSQ